MADRSPSDGLFEVIQLVSLIPNVEDYDYTFDYPPKIRLIQEERGLFYESLPLFTDKKGGEYWKLHFCFPVLEKPNDIQLQFVMPDGVGNEKVQTQTLSSLQLWKTLSARRYQYSVGYPLKKVKLQCSFVGERWTMEHQIPSNKNIKIPSVELFFGGAKQALEYQIQEFKGVTTNDIRVPTTRAGPQKMATVFPNEPEWAWFQVLDNDPECPVDWKVLAGLKFINILPDQDLNHFISRAEAIRQLPTILRELAKPHEGRWVHPDGTLLTGDALMTRFFFTNNGTHFLSKNSDGTYAADLDWMAPFSVREGYLPYGGIAFFDKETNLTHITYNPGTGTKTYRPGQEGWEFAKLVMRSSGFVAMAGVHLVACHLNWASWPNVAMRTYLPPDHPVRKLLHPHFWRSAMIARKSLLSLIPAGGLLHRGTGFDLPGLHGLYKHVQKTFVFETLPEELERRNLHTSGDVFPLAKDGVEFREIMVKYVSSYIDLYYESDKAVKDDEKLKGFWGYTNEFMLKNNKKDYHLRELTLASLKVVLAEMIFRVTGWHQHIGNAIALMEDPSWVSLRLVKNDSELKLVAPMESIYVQGLVTELTTMPMPTILDQNMGWEKVFEGDASANAVYKQFISDMIVFAAKVVGYNKERAQRGLGEFVDFDPHVCCVSVSS